MICDKLFWGARNNRCEEPIDSLEFCLPSRRGEQAVDVKGTPEALRQACGIRKGWMILSRLDGIPELYQKLALPEITRKATCLIRQARDTA